MTSCDDMAELRSRLETVRDRRMGHLDDLELLRHFRELSTAFGAAKRAHQAETGCTKWH